MKGIGKRLGLAVVMAVVFAVVAGAIWYVVMPDMMPGAEPAGSTGGSDGGGDTGAVDAMDTVETPEDGTYSMCKGSELDECVVIQAAETPEDGMYYMRNDTDFKQTLTHRYVMHPPCATVLDSTGMMEVRMASGFPEPCQFDYNGNGLGDGWEDQNNDGYADGFTDCTKPYVFEDGWYVRDLRRDCTYGAPPTKEYKDAGKDIVGSENADTKEPTLRKMYVMVEMDHIIEMRPGQIMAIPFNLTNTNVERASFVNLYVTEQDKEQFVNTPISAFTDGIVVRLSKSSSTIPASTGDMLQRDPASVIVSVPGDTVPGLYEYTLIVQVANDSLQLRKYFYISVV